MEYRYSAPVFFVVREKSVVILAPGCVDSETTELVVDEFAYEDAGGWLRNEKRGYCVRHIPMYFALAVLKV